MLTQSECIAGGLLGLLVGDALGVPYEFNTPDNIPALSAIELEPPSTFSRTYPNVPPGTWSDDGAQALCLLDSLLTCGRVEPDDLAQRFLKWYNQGYMAVDGCVFDVGNQTSRALKAIESGMPVLEAGALGQESKGNGSLMRVLPLVLWHPGSDAQLVADAQLQSCVTHGQLTCQVCCAVYCLWARRVMHATPDPWEDAIATLRQIYPAGSPEAIELEATLRPDDPPHGTGTGYVVDCLHSARLVMRQASYEQVVKAAIALGHDTDTTACVAGGIAGLREGVAAIPDRWLSQLRGRDLVEPLLAKLLR